MGAKTAPLGSAAAAAAAARNFPVGNFVQLRGYGASLQELPISHAHLDELPVESGIRAAAASGPGALRWRPAELSGGARVAQLVEQCRAIAARAGGVGLHGDIEWLLGRDPARLAGVRLLVFRDGLAAGYAVLLVRSRALRFQLGEITLFRRQLRYFTLSGEPVLADVDEASRPGVIREFLAAMRAMMQPGDALALEGVPVDSPLDRVIQARRRLPLIATRLGTAFEHQFIDMPATWDDYEHQLGTRSRKSLRYSCRKLAEALDGALTVRCFTQPDHVEAFVADATEISRKTYQWNLLGLGLRDHDGLAERLAFAAKRGWMRCYALYCRDAPTAFMVGLLHGDTYHYLDVGYDPDWAKWSVGSVLQVEVMRDLFTLRPPPRWFDFSTGYGAHKARFANCARREINYLLLPRGPRSRLLVTGYRATEATSTGIARLLERYDLKARLKKLVRSRATARAGQSSSEVSS